MSTVYAVTRCKPHQDMTPAGEFGDLTYIFGQETWREVLADPGEMFERACEELSEFDPEKDYFLPIGDMTLVTMCATAVAQVSGGKFNLLVWNPRRGYYEAVRVE